MPKKKAPARKTTAVKAEKKAPVQKVDQRDHLTILADDIARFNNGEVDHFKVYEETGVLAIILKDGRKFKVNFNRDDPTPII